MKNRGGKKIKKKKKNRTGGTLSKSFTFVSLESKERKVGTEKIMSPNFKLRKRHTFYRFKKLSELQTG